MAKLTLNDVSSGFISNTAHNTNNTLIETALENTLSRDGTGPNQMDANLDMNNHRVVNLQEPINDNEAARLVDVQNAISGSKTANLTSFTPYSNISSTNVQAALQEEIDDLTSSSGASLVGFTQVGTGAVTNKKIQDKLRETINVTDYGASTSLLDNSKAFLDAITAASTLGIKNIGVPQGIFLFTSPIINATTMPYGLRFYTLGPSNGLTGDTGTILKFTSSGILFNIIESLGTNEVGNWEWEGFTFVATHKDGSIIQLNDVTINPTNDATTSNYIRQVAFKNCKFIGINYQGQQPLVTGNGIQGSKVFELNIDDRCEFKGWCHGVWLHGCDNNIIKGRFVANVRHIHLGNANTFGNDNTIDARFFGILISTGIIPDYAIYDDASHTTIYNPEFETGSNNSVATMYFGNEGSTVFNPQFGAEAVPLFELGPTARDVTIYSPVSTVTIVDRNPIYGTASTIDTRTNGFYGVTVFAPSARIQYNLQPNRRLNVIGENKTFEKTCTYTEGLNLALSNNGISARRGHCSPLHYIGESADLGSPPPSIITDTGGHFGYTIQTQAVNTSGFGFLLWPEKHFTYGDTIKVSVLYRMPAVLSTGDYRVQLLKTDAVDLGATVMTYSPTYTTITQTTTLAGFSSTDYLRIKIYNNAADGMCNIAAIIWEVVDPAIADTSGATLGNLEIEVNKLKATMRRFGIIGG